MKRADPLHGSAKLRTGVLSPLEAFFRLETASGIVLLAATLVALAWANLAADSPLYGQAKVAILAGSLVSALAGVAVLAGAARSAEAAYRSK